MFESVGVFFLAILGGLGRGSSGDGEVGSSEERELSKLGEAFAGIKDEKSLKVRCSGGAGFFTGNEVGGVEGGEGNEQVIFF